MATILVNDIEIYHEVHGRRRRTVVARTSGGPVVISAGPFRSGHPLNKHFRVLHYDQRGLGRTDKPEIDTRWPTTPMMPPR